MDLHLLELTIMTYASPQNQIIASFGASDRAKEKLTTLSHTGKPWGQSEHRPHILLVESSWSVRAHNLRTQNKGIHFQKHCLWNVLQFTQFNESYFLSPISNY